MKLFLKGSTKSFWEINEVKDFPGTYEGRETRRGKDAGGFTGHTMEMVIEKFHQFRKWGEDFIPRDMESIEFCNMCNLFSFEEVEETHDEVKLRIENEIFKH